MPLEVTESAVRDVLAHVYGLSVCEIHSLPWGADLDVSVFRVVCADGDWFLKLRNRPFDPVTLELASWLYRNGFRQVIPPLRTSGGDLHCRLSSCYAAVYPFVAGENGFEQALTQEQWRDFAGAVGCLHRLTLPEEIARRLPREAYRSDARERVLAYLSQPEESPYADDVAQGLARFISRRKEDILHVVERAESLASVLKRKPLPFVPCHNDLHAGNLLISSDGLLHIVDWDAPMLAPKERDLMFIGGGLPYEGYSAGEQAALFYPHYGSDGVDREALAYYRFERIVQDILEYCEQLYRAGEGKEERAQSLRYLMYHFEPESSFAMALAADRLITS